MSISARRLSRSQKASPEVLLTSTLSQQNSGTWNGTNLTVSLPTAPAATSCLVLIVAGNTTVTTPSGWTQRESQVNYMGHYLYTLENTTASSWVITTAAGSGTWWLGEVTHAGYDISGSANVTTGEISYTTPNITPTAGDRILIASIASIADSGNLTTRTVSGWTDSFAELADLCYSGSDYSMQGVAMRSLVADGTATYSTTATYSATSIGRSAIICSLTAMGIAAGDISPPTAPVVTSGSTTSSTTPTIIGTAEAGSVIALTIDNHTYTATTNSGGEWSIVVSNALTVGQTYTYSVTAKDAANNLSSATTGSLQVTSTGFAFAGQKVAIIGDSLTYQGGAGETDVPAAFTAAGWPTTAPSLAAPTVGTYFDGLDGRVIQDAVARITICRNGQFDEPDVWVIALGTNNGSDPVASVNSYIDQVFSTLGANSKIVWVNIGTNNLSNTDHQAVNQAIAAKIADRSNSVLADWWQYVSDQGNPASWWLPDGTHMTAEGYEKRNEFVARMSVEGYYSSSIIAGLDRVEWEGGSAYWSQFQKTAAAGWTDSNFFPMVSFANSFSSNAEIQWDVDHGINVYHGLNPYSEYTMLSNHQGIFYMGDPYADVYSNIMMPASFDRWVSYNTPDEIDGTSATGQEAIDTVTTLTNGYRSQNDGRIITANYTQLTLRSDWQTYGSPLINHNGVDAVSIDMYWYTIPDSSYVTNNYGNSYVSSVGNLPNPRRAASYGAMVRGMRQIDDNDTIKKPTWMFVECLSGSPGEQFVRYIEPGEMKGAVMNSIINEARGIMWFNNVASQGYEVGNVLRQAQVQGTNFVGYNQIVAMGEICAQVRTLAPIINTQSYQWDFGTQLDTMLKAKDGFAYIFAMIDSQGDPGSRTFTLPAGITGTSVEVVGESRTLTVSGGQFTDTFTYEYTYHIYKISI